MEHQVNETRADLAEADREETRAFDAGETRQAAYFAAEEHRLRAIAAFEHLGAAVQLAAASLRWNSGDPDALASAMGQVYHHLGDARASLDARAGALADGAQAESRLVPQAETAPAPSITEDWPRPQHPPEGNLVAATRSMEAVKSFADQALLGFQLAPREQGILFEVLDSLQQRAARAQQDYLNYALALEEAGAR